MTKLLTLGLLLLSCGAVEAETRYADCLHKGSDGTVYDICRMPNMNKILSESTSCEIKMKEAMKAVDQYLPYREFFTSKNATMEYCDDVCMAERALDAAKKQAAAMAKWQTVYKECVQ